MDNFEQKIPYYQADIRTLNEKEILDRCYEALSAGDVRWGLYFCEEVLRRNPQNAEGYLCRVLVENNCRTVEQLAECDNPIDVSGNFRYAVYYASEELKATLNGYAQKVNERILFNRNNQAYNKAKELYSVAGSKEALESVMAEFKALGDFADSADYVKQCEERIKEISDREVYAIAVQKLQSDDLNVLLEAKALLETIPGFMNTDELLADFDNIYSQKQQLLQKREEEARKIEQQRIEEKEIKARKTRKIIGISAIAFTCVAIIAVASWLYFIPLIRYNVALSHIEKGNYDKGYSILNDLDDFKNSKDKIKEDKYRRANELFEKGDYAAAYTLFSEIGDYSDAQSRLDECLYMEGIVLIDQKQWSKAKNNFQRLGNYKQSREYIKECIYMEADDFSKKGKWEEAMNNYFSLVAEGGYKDSEELLKEARYNCGKIFAENGRIVEAIELFEMVGDDYKESGNLKKQAMFNYVKNHQNSEDEKTYEYLLLLKADDYSTSKEIYNSLFGWRTECIINDDRYGTSDMYSISRYSYVYFHITLKGGPPEGKTTVRYVITFPGGSTQKGKFAENWMSGDTGVTWVWYTNPQYASTGNAYIKLYDADNNLIGEDSIYITY